LNDQGEVIDFAMNDKCAAGTGKFLEVMARALGLSLDEFNTAAFQARASTEEPLQISAMCTVFAESEVIGLVHRGEDRSRIAMAVHASVARRTLGLLRRVGARGPMAFVGGVAKNASVVDLLRNDFGDPVLVPDDCQVVGALGAALFGMRLFSGADGRSTLGVMPRLQQHLVRTQLRGKVAGSPA
jgi:predicted CoA-substrate-specific enzyme activase